MDRIDSMIIECADNPMWAAYELIKLKENLELAAVIMRNYECHDIWMDLLDQSDEEKAKILNGGLDDES